MKSASEAEITGQVNQYANQVAALAGNPLFNPATSSAPCSGRGGEMNIAALLIGVLNIRTLRCQKRNLMVTL
ncbi:hypothetical protein [Micromonospora psammae]|uniref:hypothetical protein n=1 Tax=Micromonospora sp. CPCC 205556 TaxID=3122398 RepID=UPI002FF06413